MIGGIKLCVLYSVKYAIITFMKRVCRRTLFHVLYNSVKTVQRKAVF